MCLAVGLAPSAPSVGVGVSNPGSVVASSDAQNTADNSTLLGSILTSLNTSNTVAPTPWYAEPWVWLIGVMALVAWLVFR